MNRVAVGVLRKAPRVEGIVFRPDGLPEDEYYVVVDQLTRSFGEGTRKIGPGVIAAVLRTSVGSRYKPSSPEPIVNDDVVVWLANEAERQKLKKTLRGWKGLARRYPGVNW